jgi:polyhydroxyalkanoate synthesis regulator phasin
MKMRKEEYKIKTFEDIIRALRDHPEWLEELRRIILTEELLRLPQRFEKFLQEEFRPLKADVGKLKNDVGKLKNDVGKLKEDVKGLKDDVAGLKGSDFERQVRERAPSYFGRLIRKCRVVSLEKLSDILEEAVEKGVIRDEEMEDALNVDLVVEGILKSNKEGVVLVCEVSCTADVTDVERANKRAGIIGRAFNKKSIPIVVGKEVTKGAKEKSSPLGVILL